MTFPVARISAYRLPHTVHRLPSTVYRLPSTVYRLPSTVYRLPSTVYRLPSTVYRLPSTVYRLPSTAYRPTMPCRRPSTAVLSLALASLVLFVANGPAVAADGRLVITVTDRETKQPVGRADASAAGRRKTSPTEGCAVLARPFCLSGRNYARPAQGTVRLRSGARSRIPDPSRPLHHRRVRRRHEAGRDEAVHRHGGRWLVVGRFRRPTARR